MKKYAFTLLVFLIASSFMMSCPPKNKSKNQPLVGTYWQLISIQGVDVTYSPKEPFIEFNNEGKFNGSLGCNAFFGEYFAKKKKISVDYIGSTKRLCNDMTIEHNFTKALKNEITHYQIHGDTLKLLNKQKEILRFIAATKPVEIEE